MPLNSARSLAWVGAALALTSATQLRVPGLPLGIGEILLAVWSVAAACVLLLNRRVTRSPVPRIVGGFWVVVAAAMAAGTAAAWLLYREPGDGSAAHDAMAFTFLGSILVLLLLPQGMEPRLRGAYARMIPVLVVPLLVLAAWHRTVPLGPFSISPFEWLRFKGWAENPNQTALALLLIPFVGFRLADEAATPRRRRWLKVCTVAAIPLALLTASDALILSWMVGGGIVGAAAWLRLATAPGRGVWSRGAAYLVLPAVLLLTALTAGPALARLADARALATYNEGDQGSTRVDLWTHGLQAWSASPVLGLGPGKHSGYLGPFLDEEAHNSFIDFGASTGAAGLLAYAGFLLWAARRVLRSRSPALVAGLAVMVSYSMFHYVLRHPVYWVGLVLLVVLADGVPARGAGAAPPGEEMRRA